MFFTIQPVSLLRALSLSLELSAGGLSRHHWRTAIIANRIAEHIGISDAQRQILLFAALLHDIGAASSWEETRKLRSLAMIEDIRSHAEAGYSLLKDSPYLGMLAEPIRYHHDNWDGSGLSQLAGGEIPLLSRIINIADRIELLIHDGIYIFDQRPDILAAIRKLSGSLFDPDLVRAVHEFAKQESFWLDLVNPHYYQNFFAAIDAHGRIRFSIDDIIQIADIFATIIDRTSRFTATHSQTVARVAAYLAEVKGYSGEEIKLMRIAGLLHDLGKLAIPNTILEKPDKLNAHEIAIIKQHTYYTYRILEQIDGFGLIAEWAAYHHETLDGTGYPFHIPEEGLKLGARIVAVADIFAALTESRPYRTAMKISNVEQIMHTMAANHKIDGRILADLFSYKEDFLLLANKSANLVS